MENIVIRIHEDNLITFNQKLADLNAKFVKKNLPLINCKMASEIVEENHVNGYTPRHTLYTATLSSDFNQTNLSGVDVTFEGVVSLIDKSENDKIYTFKNISYANMLKDCKCDKCGKKISRNEYLIKGTIKAQTEYKDVKQTVITRCKVVDDFVERKFEDEIETVDNSFEAIESFFN